MALTIRHLRESQEALRKYLNVSRTTLSSEMQKLSDVGLIAIEKLGKIKVLNEFSLEVAKVVKATKHEEDVFHIGFDLYGITRPASANAHKLKKAHLLPHIDRRNGILTGIVQTAFWLCTGVVDQAQAL